MIYSILASILLVTALVLFFDLTPERVTDDILSIITPKDSMKERAKNLRGNRKKHKLYRALMKFKTALAATGKSKQFTALFYDLCKHRKWHKIQNRNRAGKSQGGLLPIIAY